jgi:hypothetical protein
MKDGLESIWKEAISVRLRHHFEAYLEGQSKAKKYLRTAGVIVEFEGQSKAKKYPRTAGVIVEFRTANLPNTSSECMHLEVLHGRISVNISIFFLGFLSLPMPMLW